VAIKTENKNTCGSSYEIGQLKQMRLSDRRKAVDDGADVPPLGSAIQAQAAVVHSFQ
jgi:hypothetical protein